jgi:hypothetical protein
MLLNALVVKISLVVLCSGLYLLGGLFQHNLRRFVMPLVIAIGIDLILRSWWVGLTVLPVAGVLCLGYGEKSPFRKTLTDAGARGMYLFLSCFVIGLAMLFTSHLIWPLFALYAIMAGVLGGTLRTMPIYIGDPIFGAFIGLIGFIIR